MTAKVVGTGSEYEDRFPIGASAIHSIALIHITLASSAAAAPAPSLYDAYKANGYVILKAALNADELTAVRAECDGLCDAIGSGDTRTLLTAAAVSHSLIYSELSCSG